MSIQSIRNPILRRVTLVATIIPFSVLFVVLGVLGGLGEAFGDYPEMVSSVWNGPRRTKAGLRLW
jgi:hypothetical protein